MSAVVAARFPELADPIAAVAAIRAGQIWVDGFPVTNPDSFVAHDASIAMRVPQPLAGEAKLRAALAAFAPTVSGRVAVDVGACTGGFTRVLLDAARVASTRSMPATASSSARCARTDAW